MKKNLIISYDDLGENNDHWEEFEKFAEKFPDLKITFFVITGQSNEEYFKKIKQSWSQLVFHSWEHSGHWLKWTKNEAKEQLMKYQKYGFEKGFKAPGWRLTDNIKEACKELDFWICTPSTIPVETKYWYTDPKKGLRDYKDYAEFYDHVEHRHYDIKEEKWYEDPHIFKENLEKLKKYCIENKPEFKFVSEMLK